MGKAVHAYAVALIEKREFAGITLSSLRLRDREVIITGDNIIFRVYGYLLVSGPPHTTEF